MLVVTVYSCKLINYLHPHIFGARLIESNRSIRKQNCKEENKQEEGWKGWWCHDELLCQSKKKDKKSRSQGAGKHRESGGQTQQLQ